MFKTFRTTLDLLGPERLPQEEHGSASRWRLALGALLPAGAAAMVFGAAAGSVSLELALPNLLKLPVVVLAPLVFSWPVGALFGHLAPGELSGSSLLLSQTVGVLGAALTLAAAAPFVALFYGTAPSTGGLVVFVTALLAGLVGLGLYARSILMRRQRAGITGLVLAVVCLAFHGLATLQLIALTSPILPEVTRFSQGLPGLLP